MNDLGHFPTHLHNRDRAGNPVDHWTWMRLYKDSQVALDEVGFPYKLSTVWLPEPELDKPRFETAVLKFGVFLMVMQRYRTEEEAIEGHQALLTQLRAKWQELVGQCGCGLHD